MAKGNDSEIQSGRTLRGTQVGDNIGFGGMDCTTVPSKLPPNRCQQLVGLIPSRYPGGLTTMPGFAYDDETPLDDNGKNIYYPRAFLVSMIGPNNEERQVKIILKSRDIRMKPRIVVSGGEPRWENSWSENLYERFNLGNLINTPGTNVRRSVFVNTKLCQVSSHEGKVRISSGNGRFSPPIIMQYIDTQFFADTSTAYAINNGMMPNIRLGYRDIWVGPALLEENEEVGDYEIPDEWFIQLTHDTNTGNKIKQGYYSFSLSPILDEYQYGLTRGFKPFRPDSWDGVREWVIKIDDGTETPMTDGAIVWKAGLNMRKRIDGRTELNYINPRLNKVAIFVRFAPIKEPYTWSEPYLSCILDLNKIASHAQPIEELALIDGEIEGHWATVDSSLIEFYWWRDTKGGQYCFKTAGVEFGGAFGGDTCSALLGHNAHNLPSRERVTGAYYSYSRWYNGQYYVFNVSMPKKAAFEWLNEEYKTATGEFRTIPQRKASRTHDKSDWEERIDLAMYCAKSIGKAIPDVIPPLNIIETGIDQNDELVGAVEYDGMLNIFSKNHRYPIIVDEIGAHKSSYTESHSGLKNPRSLIKLGNGTVVFASQSGIKILNGSKSVTISNPIDSVYKSASQSYKEWMNEGWISYSPEWNLLFVQFPAYGSALFENQKQGRNLVRIPDDGESGAVRYVDARDIMQDYKTNNYRVFVGCLDFLDLTGTVEWAEADYPIDMTDSFIGNDGKMYIFDGRTFYKFGHANTSEVQLLNSENLMVKRIIRSRIYYLSRPEDNDNISMYKYWEVFVAQYSMNVDLLIRFYINYSKKPVAFRTFSNPHAKYKPYYYRSGGYITDDPTKSKDANPINSQVPDIMDYRMLPSSNNLTMMYKGELQQEFKGKVIEYELALMNETAKGHPDIRFENLHYEFAPIPSENSPKPVVAGREHVWEPITNIPNDPTDPNEYPRIPTNVPDNPIVTPGDEQEDWPDPLPVIEEIPYNPTEPIPGIPCDVLEPEGPGLVIIEDPPDPSVSVPTTVEIKQGYVNRELVAENGRTILLDYNKDFKNSFALYSQKGAVLVDKGDSINTVKLLTNGGINLSNVSTSKLATIPSGALVSGGLSLNGDFTLSDTTNIYLKSNSQIVIAFGTIESKQYALTQNQDNDYLVMHPNISGDLDIVFNFENTFDFDLTKYKYRLSHNILTDITYYIKIYNYSIMAWENCQYFDGSITTFYKTYMTSSHISSKSCKYKFYVTGKTSSNYIKINQIRVIRQNLE